MNGKKRFFSFLFGLLSIFFFASCNSQGEIKEDEPIEEKEEESYGIKDYQDILLKSPSFETRKIAKKEDVTYEDLFNLGNRIDIKISIKESEIEKLQADYQWFYDSGKWKKVETYHIAESVTISLTNYSNTFTWTFEQVGIRQKGNTSRNSIVNDSGYLNMNHYKLSFDETFDSIEEYGEDAIDWTGREDEKLEREEREFLGLSGLDIKVNATADESYIRELYASKMYQAAGLITQYIGLTTVTFYRPDKDLKEYMGVYLLYEPATKSMIKRHVKEGNVLNFGSWNDQKNGTYGCSGSNYGDLYRMSWGANLEINTMYGNMVGYPSYDGSYSPTYACKTNQGVEYGNNLLKALGNAVENGNYTNISEHFDLEYFAATEAVSWLLGNPDDYRDDQNNTLVYFRRSDGKGITIPVDNDRVLGVTRYWNPDGSGMTKKQIFDTTRGADKSEVFNIYTKTILAEKNTPAKHMYLNYIKALASSSWVKASTFKGYYDMARKSYQSYIKSDKWYFDFNMYSTKYNDYSFVTYMKEKLKLVDFDYQLDGVFVPDRCQINEIEDYLGYYGNIYLVGDFNNWKGQAYRFTYKGNGIYELTVKLNREGSIWYKIYDGKWLINWSIVDNQLIMHDIDAQQITNLKKNTVLKIVINTITQEASITKTT